MPTLPIVTLAQATATLALGESPRESTWAPVVTKADRERWNDWGIGLLLQGDLKAAEYAFRQVTQAEPAYADGWLNVARALIQEGQMDAAKPFLDQALRIDDRLERIHYFRSLVQKAEGDYAGALASFERVAAKYPRDRVVLNQLARVLFLKRRFADAIEVLRRVSLVDPEDIQMHYMAMLCYRASATSRALRGRNSCSAGSRRTRPRRRSRRAGEGSAPKTTTNGRLFTSTTACLSREDSGDTRTAARSASLE